MLNMHLGKDIEIKSYGWNHNHTQSRSCEHLIIKLHSLYYLDVLPYAGVIGSSLTIGGGSGNGLGERSFIKLPLQYGKCQP